MCLKICFNLSELLLKRQVKIQAFDDLIKTSLNFRKDICEILSCFCFVITCIQKISYLCVCGKSLSRCGRYHITSALIASDDISDLLKLFCIGQRASSKFYHFFHNNTYHPSVFSFQSENLSLILLKTSGFCKSFFIILHKNSLFMHNIHEECSQEPMRCLCGICIPVWIFSLLPPLHSSPFYEKPYL